MWCGEGQGWDWGYCYCYRVGPEVHAATLLCVYPCIQLCLKCSSQTSRLRIQEMASIIQRMKKFNNMIRMVR